MGFVVSRYVYSWQKCELLAGLCIVYKSVSLLAGVCVDSQQDSVSHGNGEVVSVQNLVIIEVWDKECCADGREHSRAGNL